MRPLKNKFIAVRKQLFEEITVFEYVLWWIARAMMLYVVIFCQDSERVMCFINMLALYAMSALRFIAPKNSFIARLDFRCQHIINFIEIVGTFFGNFLNAYAHVFKYDRILHFISGPLAVAGGYFIVKALVTEKDKNASVPAALASVFSGCFSFMVICLWEITEFLGDFFWGTQNQCFYYAPFDDDIWFRLFGPGFNRGEGQYPLWDTMMDMIDATVTTAIGAIVLYAVIKLVEKRRKSRRTASAVQMLPEEQTQ